MNKPQRASKLKSGLAGSTATQKAPAATKKATVANQKAPAATKKATAATNKVADKEPKKKVAKKTPKSKKNKDTKRPKQSTSSKAGLVFPAFRMYRFLKTRRFAKRISLAAGIYLAAVLEYMSAEVLELAGNQTRDAKRKRIIPRHIYLAIKQDEELNLLCKKQTIAGGGTIELIHKPLLQTPKPKRTSKVTSTKKKSTKSKAKKKPAEPIEETNEPPLQEDEEDEEEEEQKQNNDEEEYSDEDAEEDALNQGEDDEDDEDDEAEEDET